MNAGAGASTRTCAEAQRVAKPMERIAAETQREKKVMGKNLLERANQVRRKQKRAKPGAS
jgi:hypothetical protein